MVSVTDFRKMALSFPEVMELPHFDRASFRVNKKIFATLLEMDKTANLKLSPVNQSVFSLIDKAMIYPVPNKWGLHGSTTVELKLVNKKILKDILTKAYCEVAPARLSENYFDKE